MIERNALELAVDRVGYVFGNPGKAALRLFLASLPADATIAWGDKPELAQAEMVAQQLYDELESNP